MSATDKASSRKLPDEDETGVLVREAVQIANAVELTLVGHDGRACVYALGWALGAYVASGDNDVVDLDRLVAILGREARRKFNGVRNGSWSSNPLVQAVGRA